MATSWLAYGQTSVDVFIVLSGFCLMLPVARGNGLLRGGFWQFARRRALRILPPYYAAVGLSLLLIWLLPCLSHPKNGLWTGALPAFSAGAIISHLLLVHNLSNAWIHKIDYPLWSVATEWQIYFIFALILLPVWRRFGIISAVITSFLVSYLPSLIFHHAEVGGLTLLVLFAFGMWAATLAVNESVHRSLIKGLAMCSVVCLASLPILIGFSMIRKNSLFGLFTFHDIPVGIVTALMLLFSATISQATPITRIMVVLVRLLELPAFVFLGTFSYSLYLIHAPLIAIVFAIVRPLHASAMVTLLTCELIGLPICIDASYVFHLIFERPYLRNPKPSVERQTEMAAVVAPTP